MIAAADDKSEMSSVAVETSSIAVDEQYSVVVAAPAPPKNTVQSAGADDADVINIRIDCRAISGFAEKEDDDLP